MIFTVWTGTKFKGAWADKEMALRYMAARSPDERGVWKLVPVDPSASLDAEVEAMVGKIAEEQKKPAGEVHHLKAQGIEASSKGEVH